MHTEAAYSMLTLHLGSKVRALMDSCIRRYDKNDMYKYIVSIWSTQHSALLLPNVRLSTVMLHRVVVQMSAAHTLVGELQGDFNDHWNE